MERGGHSILEPAAFEKPIVFGPHMENFREIRNLFVNDGTSIEVGSAAELAPAVGRVLAEPETSAELCRQRRGGPSSWRHRSRAGVPARHVR